LLPMYSADRWFAVDPFEWRAWMLGSVTKVYS